MLSKEQEQSYHKQLHNSLISESDRYALMRKFKFKEAKSKITPEVLRKEVLTARVLGELSSVERIIETLVKYPDMDREQLEAELQLFAVGCNNTAAEMLGSSHTITVDDILDVHGYYADTKEKLQ